MAKAREIPDLDGAESFRRAAARIVAVRTDEVFEHAGDVLDMTDIEGVHDMRVATRRLRAVLEIFAPCFPKQAHRSILREVKALADTLGERRDPDVAVASLEHVGAALTAEDRHGIALMTDDLRAQQQAANKTLAATLAAIERDGLRQRLLALAATADIEAVSEPSSGAGADADGQPR